MSENTNNNIPEKVSESDSIFRIDDVYTVQKDNVPSTFLSGTILKGTLRDGEGIVIYNPENNPVLTCKITGIERIGRDSFKEISYNPEGSENDNAYGIWVDNDNADLFKGGYYITSLVNGRNKTNKERLSQERMNELFAMIDDGDKEAFRFLSIQELSAIVQKMNKDNNPERRELHEHVVGLLYKKISDADEIYITIDENTRQPFFNNGNVDIYSVESYAEDAVDFYGKQFRKLKVLAATKENLSCPLFIWLKLLGIKTVTVDNGQHHVPLDVDKFLTDEDRKNTLIEESDSHPPFYNPDFRFAMNTCLSELRWPVNYPERKANCDLKDQKMWDALAKAHLIVPIKKNDDKDKNIPKGQVAIPHINNNNNEEFIGLFTDMDELAKLYKLDDWGLMLMGPKQAFDLDDNIGLVINPMGENLIITKDKLPEYRKRLAATMGENDGTGFVSGSGNPTNTPKTDGPTMRVAPGPGSSSENNDSGITPPPLKVKVTTTKSDGTVETVEHTSNGTESSSDSTDPNAPRVTVSVSKPGENPGEGE
jgi:hypothetical protein